MEIDKPSHVVAIFGGACAGSMAAEILASSGCQVVVFDQNPRPYGKIEDGLPRWHDKQRRMEYERINARIGRAGVTYVPCTKLGVDIDFLEFAREWGWSAVVLATGAWKDRPLAAAGAAEAEGNGLIYQNPFIYWFNHKHEAAYDGPGYEIAAPAICIGGGLASIDVIKIIQLELYAAALRGRGHADVDVVEMEHRGLPKFLQEQGIDDPSSLGVRNGTLIYRRRIDDMPLASADADAPAKVRDRLPETRKKILQKAQERFLFEVRAQTLPLRVVTEGARVTGLEVCDTRVEGRDAVPVPGSEQVLPAALIVSSIGSIPEPVAGVEMRGVYYAFGDGAAAPYEPIPGVFGTGNVVTGQGNIKVSLDHGKQVANALIESYLGIGADGERDLTAAFAAADSRGAAVAGQVQEELARVAPLPAARVRALLDRARARQRQVGYDGSYAEWLARVTPADLA